MRVWKPFTCERVRRAARISIRVRTSLNYKRVCLEVMRARTPLSCKRVGTPENCKKACLEVSMRVGALRFYVSATASLILEKKEFPLKANGKKVQTFMNTYELGEL